MGGCDDVQSGKSRKSRVSCRDFVEFVDDYIECELNPTVRATFEKHINDCGPCQCYLKTYRDTVRIARSICPNDDSPVPAEVPEALIQAILRARES
jgi:anti-sigma factor RsiW